MSRTAHSRGPSTRYARRATWERAFIGKWADPGKVQRKTERGEIEAELSDLQLAAWDPEILLWGATLTTPKIARERDQGLRSGVLVRGPGLVGWDAWDDYTYWDDRDYYDDYGYGCGACDSGCACAMRRQADEAYENWSYDDRYDHYWHGDDYLDPQSPAWRDAWVAGEVSPSDWDGLDYSQEYWCDDSDDDPYESDWCDGCGELHMHCEWLRECWDDVDYTEGDPRDASATWLSDERARERHLAGERGRLRAASRR